jgi:hypothetical protein
VPRAKDVSDEAFLREQAAWMGLIAELSVDDIEPPWMWNSAAEKADLVDTLVTAAAGSQTPVTEVLRRLQTLTRGTDPLPRAIAAELAQLALAALGGVKSAAEPDRRGVVKIKERPSEPAATAQERADHQAREDLRSTAHALVGRDTGLPDPFNSGLFRDKLSTGYVDAFEQLRLTTLKSDNLTGEERYHRCGKSRQRC